MFSDIIFARLFKSRVSFGNVPLHENLHDEFGLKNVDPRIRRLACFAGLLLRNFTIMGLCIYSKKKIVSQV